ncbi:MAG: hypothetical protein ABII71_02790 [Candidatus Micrarchaeota archaeon]
MLLIALFGQVFQTIIQYDNYNLLFNQTTNTDLKKIISSALVPTLAIAALYIILLVLLIDLALPLTFVGALNWAVLLYFGYSTVRKGQTAIEAAISGALASVFSFASYVFSIILMFSLLLKEKTFDFVSFMGGFFVAVTAPDDAGVFHVAALFVFGMLLVGLILKGAILAGFGGPLGKRPGQSRPSPK